jgi:HTH-type transcriptional regulator, quorum sensing regulator NprR
MWFVSYNIFNIVCGGIVVTHPLTVDQQALLTSKYKTIGEKVRSQRKQRGLSQEELASGICSRQTISFLENGQHLPSADIIRKVCERLSIPLREVMGDDLHGFNAKVKLSILRVHVKSEDYTNALMLVRELEDSYELLEHEKRELDVLTADCLIRTGDAHQAVLLLARLQTRLETQRESDEHLLAQVYDKLGTAYFYLSNMTNAHAYYLRAYQLAQRFEEYDLLAARITYNLGMVYRQLERHTDAIEHLMKAESYFQHSSDLTKLATTYFELGIAYRFRDDFERADAYLQEAYTLYKALNIFSMATRSRQTHAYLVVSQNDPQRAIQELQACAYEFEKSGDSSRVSYTYAHMANLLVDQDDTSKAKEYLDVAFSLTDEDEANQDPRHAYVYEVASKFYLKINEFDNCVTYSHKAYHIFDTIGFVRQAADALNITARAFQMQGMFEQAYEVSQKVNHLLCNVSDQYSSVMEVL